MKKIIPLLVLLMLSDYSYANFYTGNDLEDKKIEDSKNSRQLEAGFYAGYVAGVAEVTRLKDNISWCEDSVTVSQLVKVVSRYLTNTPEKLHLPANTLIIEALKGAFPCKK
jgi:hypothetical protein